MSAVSPLPATRPSPPPSQRVRILVVDDHEDIRDPMAAYLQRCGFDANTAANGTQMRAALASEAAYDLILLDVMLPGEDGFSLCRHVQQQSATPVILLTARGDTADRIFGLGAGADDYVVKPFEPSELVARIGSVLRRFQRAAAVPITSSDSPIPARPSWRFRFDCWTFDAQRSELLHDSGRMVDLSAAEHRLLCVLIARPYAVMSREALLDLTSESASDVFDRSIDSQVSRLRRKLETDPRRPRILKTAWGNGYVFSASVEALD